MDALCRLVVDPHLAKADPAREALEEAVALGQLPQRRGGARRQQAEVAGILRYLLARAPVDQAVEQLHAEAAAQRLALAVRLGGVDDVVAVIEPVPDQLIDECRRMLPVAVHEQHRAAAGMVETGKQRRLLAEVARERDDLHVEPVGGKGLCRGQRRVAAAVVDIDHLGGQAAPAPEPSRHLDKAGVQGRDVRRLVEQRHHDGQAGVRPRAGGSVPGPDRRIGSHRSVVPRRLGRVLHETQHPAGRMQRWVSQSPRRRA